MLTLAIAVLVTTAVITAYFLGLTVEHTRTTDTHPTSDERWNP